MAIKIGTNEVIDNSRSLLNVNNLSGDYDDFQPNVATIGTVIDFDTPMMYRFLTSGTTFTESNKSAGHTAVLLLDTSTGFIPTFGTNIVWAESGNEPLWANNRYWVLSFTCRNTTTVFAAATGYSF